MKTIMAIEIAKTILGNTIIEIRKTEQGRGARGKSLCDCGSLANFLASSDIGGICIHCPKCGKTDLQFISCQT